MISQILQFVEGNGQIYLSSAYLNLPDRFLKLLNLSNLNLNILTSSPEANGFYRANNVSKYLPDAYSYLEEKLLEKYKNISIYEYSRPGWTFHAKGFWANFKYLRHDWTVSTIGSSNFNSRSFNTDLESQTFIFTRNPSLGKQLQLERQKLFSNATLVSPSDLKSRNIQPLVKLATNILRPWL